MNVHKIYETADRYVAGELSIDERTDIDDRLLKDKEFAKIFAEYLALNEAARRSVQSKRKAELMLLFQERGDTKQNITNRALIVRRFWAAAAVITICFIGFWLWNLKSNDYYLEAKTIIFQERIYDKTKLSDEQFTKLFKEKKYEEALALLQLELPDIEQINRPQNLERQGFCYWQLNNFSAALNSFEMLEKDSVLTKDSNPAIWYQALTYLKMDEEEKSKSILRKLANDTKHHYNVRARNLLMNLNR